MESTTNTEHEQSEKTTNGGLQSQAEETEERKSVIKNQCQLSRLRYQVRSLEEEYQVCNLLVSTAKKIRYQV